MTYHTFKFDFIAKYVMKIFIFTFILLSNTTVYILHVHFLSIHTVKSLDQVNIGQYLHDLYLKLIIFFKEHNRNTIFLAN